MEQSTRVVGSATVLLRSLGLLRPYEGRSFAVPWRFGLGVVLTVAALAGNYARDRRQSPGASSELYYSLGICLFVAFGMLMVFGVVRVVVRGRATGVVLLGWGFGMVQLLPSFEPKRGWRGFTVSSPVGVFLVNGRLAVAMFGRKDMVRASPSFKVVLGERGRGRWVSVEEAGERVEFRLWSTKHLR